MENNKKAFTLAEVMVVLGIIGVLAAILLPIANSSRPDENVMKFKKANTTLGKVIHELVTSDSYYLDGMMNKKASGEDVSDDYFCKAFADIVSAKYVKCKTGDGSGENPVFLVESLFVKSQKIDKSCADYEKTMAPEIITSDGIVWYTLTPSDHFSTETLDGFYHKYKIVCLDVDAQFNANGTIKKDKNNNELWGPAAPFGYGIRVDGKIAGGALADEWAAKSMQKGKKDN